MKLIPTKKEKNGRRMVAILPDGTIAECDRRNNHRGLSPLVRSNSGRRQTDKINVGGKMQTTLVIYDTNHKPIRAFEYDDSCNAMRMEAMGVIQEYTDLSNYGHYTYYHGKTVGQVFAKPA